MSADIVEMLRSCADESWPYAEALSNTGHPERDNNVGKAATAMREAADEITRLRADNDSIREQRDGYDYAHAEAMREVERLRAERDALESEATELRVDNETLAADVMRLRTRVEELEGALKEIASPPAIGGDADTLLRLVKNRARRALTSQEEDA